jgi:hypothetical protein
MHATSLSHLIILDLTTLIMLWLHICQSFLASNAVSFISQGTLTQLLFWSDNAETETKKTIFILYFLINILALGNH